MGSATAVGCVPGAPAPVGTALRMVIEMANFQNPLALSPDKTDDEVIHDLAARFGVDPADFYLEVFDEQFGA